MYVARAPFRRAPAAERVISHGSIPRPRASPPRAVVGDEHDNGSTRDDRNLAEHVGQTHRAPVHDRIVARARARARPVSRRRDTLVVGRAPTAWAPAPLPHELGPYLPLRSTRHAPSRRLRVPVRYGPLPGDTDCGSMSVPFGLRQQRHAAAHRAPLPPSYVVREVVPTVPACEAPQRGLRVRVTDRRLPGDADGRGSPVPLLLAQPTRHDMKLARDADDCRGSHASER